MRRERGRVHGDQALVAVLLGDDAQQADVGEPLDLAALPHRRVEALAQQRGGEAEHQAEDQADEVVARRPRREGLGRDAGCLEHRQLRQRGAGRRLVQLGHDTRAGRVDVGVGHGGRGLGVGAGGRDGEEGARAVGGGLDLDAPATPACLERGRHGRTGRRVLRVGPGPLRRQLALGDLVDGVLARRGRDQQARARVWYFGVCRNVATAALRRRRSRRRARRATSGGGRMRGSRRTPRHSVTSAAGPPAGPASRPG